MKQKKVGAGPRCLLLQDVQLREKHFLVTWQDERNVTEWEYYKLSKSDIYGQLLDPNGGKYRGGNFHIDYADDRRSSPAVAYNPDSDNFLLSFEAYRRNIPPEIGYHIMEMEMGRSQTLQISQD